MGNLLIRVVLVVNGQHSMLLMIVTEDAHMNIDILTYTTKQIRKYIFYLLNYNISNEYGNTAKLLHKKKFFSLF